MKKGDKIVQVAIVQYEQDPRSILRCTCEVARHYDTTLISRGRKAYGDYRQIRVPFFKSVILRALIVHPIVLWHCIRLKAKVYHFHNPELLILFLLLRLIGKKIIFDVHENVLGQLAVRKGNSGSLFKRLYAFFSRLSLRYFHFILAEDSYLKDYNEARTELEVVHNFPDSTTLSAQDAAKGNSSNRTELFYIGGIGFQRGLKEIIEAAALLKKEIPNFMIHLVGPLYENINKLKGLDYFAEAASVLRFHGPMPQYQALQLSQKAIAGLALLSDTPNYRESYPSKLFEYMAIGLPSIFTDFSINVQAASEAGIPIPPEDTEALVKAVMSLYQDHELWNLKSEKARQLSNEMYNWEKEKEKLLSFYLRLGLSPVS